MAEQSPYIETALHKEHLSTPYFIGTPVEVPEIGRNCEVLTKASLGEFLFEKSGESVQLNLFKDVIKELPHMSHKNEEDSVSEYKLRAAGCADGTCPYIGQVAMCWRRQELDQG